MTTCEPCDCMFEPSYEDATCEDATWILQVNRSIQNLSSPFQSSPRFPDLPDLPDFLIHFVHEHVTMRK